MGREHYDRYALNEGIQRRHYRSSGLTNEWEIAPITLSKTSTTCALHSPLPHSVSPCGHSTRRWWAVEESPLASVRTGPGRTWWTPWLPGWPRHTCPEKKSIIIICNYSIILFVCLPVSVIICLSLYLSLSLSLAPSLAPSLSFSLSLSLSLPPLSLSLSLSLSLPSLSSFLYDSLFVDQSRSPIFCSCIISRFTLGWLSLNLLSARILHSFPPEPIKLKASNFFTFTLSIWSLKSLYTFS